MMSTHWPARIPPLFVVVLVAFLAPDPAHAQFETVNLHGTVTDESGSPLPGVKVELQSEGGHLRETASDAQGRFRIPGLLPGIYQLRTELDGFSTRTIDLVVFAGGGDNEITVDLSSSPLREEVVVAGSGLSPGQKPQNRFVTTSRDLEGIPAADPWALVNRTPGVLTDRINVGGSEGGLQFSHTGPGIPGDQTLWSVDGVVITDMAALGESPAYFDAASFETFEIVTGGAGVSAPVGTVMNVVTKAGGNEFSGSARYNLGFDSTGDDSLLPDFNMAGIDHRLFDATLGGHILRDRIWFFAGYGSDRVNGTALSGGEPIEPSVDVDHFSTKISARLGATNTLTARQYWSDRVKEGRNFDRLLAPESTYVNEGAPDFFKIEDTHVFNSNFYLTGLYAIGNNDYTLTPLGGTDRAALNDSNGVWHNSFTFYETERRQQQFQSSASYLFDTAFGTHDLKFGGSYRTQETDEASGFPRDQVVREAGNDRLFYFTRDWERTFEQNNRSLWAQDTIRLADFRFDLGVRYDSESTRMAGGTLFAHPTEGSLMRQEVFEAEDTISWNRFSPTFGASYLLPDERTVLRGGWATHRQQMGTFPAEFSTNATMNPFHNSLVKQGVDLNGNGTLDISEPQTIIGILPPPPVDLLDEDLDGFDVRETWLGVEHEVLPEFIIGLTATWRSMRNAQAGLDVLTTGRVATAADYVAGPTLTGSISGYGDYSVPTFRLGPGLEFSGQQLLTNTDARTEYFGATLSFTRQLANKWTLRGHVTWQDWDWNIPEDQAARVDPNQTIGRFFDGDPFVQPSLDQGSKPDVYISGSWSYNVNGLYQVRPDRPWGFNLGFALSGRDGYPLVFYDDFTGPDDATRTIRLFDWDTFSNDPVHVFDLRVEKSLTLSDCAITLGVDIFNAFDSAAVLQRSGAVNGVVPPGTAREILGPRAMQFGAKLVF